MGGCYFFMGSNLEKYGIFWKKRPFFRADMAGLGKYCMGGYGRIGVYRDGAGERFMRADDWHIAEEGPSEGIF